MTDRGDPAKAASRIIRERAMAILRDTRAKIDPALLLVMKERLSPKASSVAEKPFSQKNDVFKRDYAPSQAAEQVTPPASADIPDANGMVPVDKQKIAQIVLLYMKNRDDKQRH